MGTDIEILIERYNSYTKNWTLVQWNDLHARYDDVNVTESPEQAPCENDDDFMERIENWHETYTLHSLQRCYKLFALLSGMRNEYDIIPYTQVRGVPDDVSASARNIINGCVNTDTQNEECSWLTSEELMDIYTNDITRSNGVLHAEYKRGLLQEFGTLVMRLSDDTSVGGSFGRIIFWYGS